jgi:23S rRNA (pseudouridine1915-N3)-methyltransferase
MIRFIFVGKLKDASLKAALDDFVLRIGRFTKIEVLEIKDEPILKNAEHAAMQKEAERILSALKDEYVIALDVKGKQLSSEEFASLIKKTELDRKIAFIVGGPCGMHESVLARANMTISFSRFTIGNQLFRVVLAEQVYRAYAIIHNTGYHK